MKKQSLHQSQESGRTVQVLRPVTAGVGYPEGSRAYS